MGSLWDDRLAEIWAPPGRQGSGVVIGMRGVLTARHVVAGGADGVLARVVRRAQQRVGGWVPMRVVWEDADWDLALLVVPDGEPQAHSWLVPASASPVLVRLGGRAEPGCESIGFPDQETQRSGPDSPRPVVRQTEQITGMLLPSGQAKAPVGTGRPLPRAWMPLDAESSTASSPAGWGGMSGSGVVLADGRLAAVVVAVDREHQHRRLYCVPLAEVLDAVPGFGSALARLNGAPVRAQARHAAAFRRALSVICLGPEGMPARLHQLDDLGAYGVKSVDLPGEPPFLNYVRRDGDHELGQALAEAARTRRMLLLAGKSGAGKSRSVAEAVRRQFPRHRLLRPVEDMLAAVTELPLDDIGSALVWLDDIERYQHGGLREMLRRLLSSGVVVVGTIRSDELAALAESHNPVGEALTDRALVRRVEWQREWSGAERTRVPQRVAHPALRQAVAMRIALGVWCVAGPQLVQRMLNSEPDDYPCRSSLLRAVLDWHRTGLTVPIPRSVAYTLVDRAYLDEPATEGELEEALHWSLAPVAVGGRRSAHSLLMADPATDTLTVNDYVQDYDGRDALPPVPRPVWEAALDVAAGDDDALSAVGWRAIGSDEQDVARRAFAPLAQAGQAEAMGIVGLLAEDPEDGTRWMRRAAETGDVYALRNFGAHLSRDQPAEARLWFERAVEAGSVSAMVDLARLLEDDDPWAAQEWFRRAAAAGDDEAMNSLGTLLYAQDPDQARELFRQAAGTGNALAMNNLGLLLDDVDEAEAESWFRKAAEDGSEEGMHNLGTVLARRGDHEGALDWLHRAAESGHTEAMRNLGIELSQHDLAAGARYWWLRAVDAGNTDAMLNLAVLAFNDGDVNDGYRSWLERGADAGSATCTFALGDLHAQLGDPEAARRCYERAADAGEPAAMAALGAMTESHEEALPWLRLAADAGDVDGMHELGRRLAGAGDHEGARAWWTRAATAGHTDAANALGHLLLAEDVQAALPWLRAAAQAGDPDAMAELAELLAVSDPEEAGEWRFRSDLYVAKDRFLEQDADPDPLRQALLTAVRDWHRTGIGRGVPKDIAFALVNDIYLDVPASTAELEDALAWAMAPVWVEGRETGFSLMYEDTDDEDTDDADIEGEPHVGGLQAVEIRDGREPPPVPDQVWHEALAACSDDPEPRRAIGWHAMEALRERVARSAFEPLAHAGDAEAMGLYGLLIGAEDPEAAREWRERAAQTRDVYGMLNYGTYLMNSGDPTTARHWLREAADAGSALAMSHLGGMLLDDDPDEARLWLRRAADAGDANAMNWLGLLASREGRRSGRDWFREAAYAGHHTAMNNLGLDVHEAGDTEGARLWFRMAAESGFDEAMRNLAMTLLDEDPPAAREWLERAAAEGNAEALYNLGVLVMDEDQDAATEYWRRAADLGDPDAMNNIGLQLRDEERFDAAQELLERAAATGNVNAMNSLGSLLSSLGRDGQARAWWERAADQGDANAMYNLGRQLLEEDPDGAVAWWQQAAEAGSQEAQAALEEG
ncbi:bifunctional trypsin-like peptidase domain-containing/SEL1-like repeat protein [Streptomyces cinnabarinus]|uniref:Bifunctional trypsin-like peptidase domain-containing/SEL1-like repeat protein n=1 Tax=Streptomyces cinnabarinus TaxID=67287 RepID=A0ABY7KEX6_9ACTN|nr:bifunctional trypsin-like peptidase domain-containing/SEL1-like repeat protein [Streptomyces cinnabarinus]WAZ21296.1 bifunctional trypsin-like peptidase domain-containing/SEL1-like repeat protein [Streptomyces cinnabarinus]